MESKILELQKMVSKYTTTWSNIQEQMNEFTLVYVARWRGKDGKRYASPFKTKDSAEKRAKELRTQGNSEVSVTQDTLKGNIKWAKDNGPDIKGMQKEDVAINMLEAMSPAQIKKLKDSWAEIKLMSPEKVKTLKNFLDKYSTDTLMQLAQSGINFVSNMARSVAMKRKTGDMKHAGSMKEETKTDNEKIADLRVKQMQLQTKAREMDPTKDKTDIEITKNKLDNIQLRMDKIKSKNEEVHPAKALVEAIKGVQNKAEKTGMPYSILKKVYDRGMAAWKGGHRPGTTPQQWAMARVNSFVTKSSGTWGGADSDLAKKVRSKK
jgi:predicted metalloenzyme YecM